MMKKSGTRKISSVHSKQFDVAELADALDSGTKSNALETKHLAENKAN
jgi:hypothetical protein